MSLSLVPPPPQKSHSILQVITISDCRFLWLIGLCCIRVIAWILLHLLLPTLLLETASITAVCGPCDWFLFNLCACLNFMPQVPFHLIFIFPLHHQIYWYPPISTRILLSMFSFIPWIPRCSLRRRFPDISYAVYFLSLQATHSVLWSVLQTISPPSWLPLLHLLIKHLSLHNLWLL